MNTIACFTILIAAATASGQGLFDDPDDILRDQPSQHQPARSDPAQALHYLPAATQDSIAKSLEAAIASIEAAMSEATAAGDTSSHDALRRHRDSLSAVLHRQKTEQFLPSIYPLGLNRKGCLFVVRENSLSLPRSGNDPLELQTQAISWFRVKIQEASPDGVLLADIIDSGGKVVLYRARISGLANPTLKAGVTAQLVNTAFECFAEELDDSGNTIYHLRRIPAESLLRPAK